MRFPSLYHLSTLTTVTAIITPLLLCQCASKSLRVDSFQLRESSLAGGLMVRGERQKRLYGAVTTSERRDRMGHYYTARWNDGRNLTSPAQSGKILFEYQQAATASKILRKEFQVPAEDKAGMTEFQIIGNEYHQGGKVLTWRASYFRGDKLIDSTQSYLWQSSLKNQ